MMRGGCELLHQRDAAGVPGQGQRPQYLRVLLPSMTDKAARGDVVAVRPYQAIKQQAVTGLLPSLRSTCNVGQGGALEALRAFGSISGARADQAPVSFSPVSAGSGIY